VPATTSSGSAGAGGRLSQPLVEAQSRTYCLSKLGFDGVANVHVGRLIELDVPDPDRLPEMCEKLLANPLVEDYELQLLDGGGGG
jgi:phosphoribosylformylglycinamidine synthase